MSTINKIFGSVDEWVLMSSCLALTDTYVTRHFYSNINLFATLTINMVVYNVVGYGMHKASLYIDKKIRNEKNSVKLYYFAAWSVMTISSGFIIGMIRK